MCRFELPLSFELRSSLNGVNSIELQDMFKLLLIIEFLNISNIAQWVSL